jgi:type III restriction enzyme
MTYEIKKQLYLLEEDAPYRILNPKEDNRQPTNAIFVDKLRDLVFKWRKNGYTGITDITRVLLNFWFENSHHVKDKPFSYFFCQREAIETLIYLYEVKKAYKYKDLKPFYTDKSGGSQIALDLFSKDEGKEVKSEFPKYCFKMATGSGKTKVMSLAIAWTYLNDYCKNFLVIAPNVIVFERLKEDFESGRIFNSDPVMPEELKSEFQLNYILRGDEPTNIRENSLVLLNIDQIKGKRKDSADTSFGRGFLTPEPNRKIEINDETYFNALKKLSSLMIINDEAHHVHDEELAWSKKIADINQSIKDNNSKGLMAQLDFTATPRYQAGGALFKHIIVDYPLADAIDSGIVKRVIIGEVTKDKENKKEEKITKRYRAWLEAGMERLREYRKLYAREGKKPVLFVMTEDTKTAEEMTEYLEKVPDLKVLTIHTDRFNNVSKKVEDKIREAARNIDTNEYNTIVSVMMLKEGWDVKNVCVIVGLRAYSAPANILPEQTIGRGLRRMSGPGYTDETLDIIGNDHFISIVDELGKEGVSLVRKPVDEKLEEINIFIDKNKLGYDIKIPIISPKYVTGAENILTVIKVEDIQTPEAKIKLELKGKVTKLEYRGWDARKVAEAIKTGQKIKEEFKRQYDFKAIRNSSEAVSFYTKVILRNAKLPENANFRLLAPIFIDYVENILFEKKVSLDDDLVIEKLNEGDIQDKIIEVFADVIKNASKSKKIIKIEKQKSLAVSRTEPFNWKKCKTIEVKNTVFNLLPFDNNYEMRFIELLKNDKDIKSFAKLIPWKFNFRLEYFGKYGGHRHYYPDFVAEDKKGKKYLIETKGFIDEDAENKKDRAVEWCNDVNMLFNENWEYVFVHQLAFEKHFWQSFKELREFIKYGEQVLGLQVAEDSEEYKD